MIILLLSKKGITTSSFVVTILLAALAIMIIINPASLTTDAFSSNACIRHCPYNNVGNKPSRYHHYAATRKYSLGIIKEEEEEDIVVVDSLPAATMCTRGAISNNNNNNDDGDGDENGDPSFSRRPPSICDKTNSISDNIGNIKGGSSKKSCTSSNDIALLWANSLENRIPWHAGSCRWIAQNRT